MAIALMALFQSGCATNPQTAGAMAGVAAFGGRAPANEIEQVYYLGVFDPQEQIPPTVYRLTIHGQASALGNTKFNSGWVPANIIDSLNTNLGFSDEGVVEVKGGDESAMSNLATGRRLILFGPEGFREAPRNHRLAIVMGSNPEDFFKAVSNTLGTMSAAQAATFDTKTSQAILRSLADVRSEREQLSDLRLEVETRIPANGGAR
jgi:hypothetical protein